MKSWFKEGGEHILSFPLYYMQATLAHPHSSVHSAIYDFQYSHIPNAWCFFSLNWLSTPIPHYKSFLYPFRVLYDRRTSGATLLWSYFLTPYLTRGQEVRLVLFVGYIHCLLVKSFVPLQFIQLLLQSLNTSLLKAFKEFMDNYPKPSTIHWNSIEKRNKLQNKVNSK